MLILSSFRSFCHFLLSPPADAICASRRCVSLLFILYFLLLFLLPYFLRSPRCDARSPPISQPFSSPFRERDAASRSAIILHLMPSFSEADCRGASFFDYFTRTKVYASRARCAEADFSFTSRCRIFTQRVRCRRSSAISLARCALDTAAPPLMSFSPHADAAWRFSSISRQPCAMPRLRCVYASKPIFFSASD